MSHENLSMQKFSALKTLADLSHIITSAHEPDTTLTQVAQMIAERMRVDACSIYVYDSKNKALVLKATYGLNQETIGEIQMPPSEGLVGLVLELSEPVQVAEMSLHPRFKHFPQTNEDSYSSFLGVPLIEHRKAFGVLAVHTAECRNFTEEEEHILVTIASQIAGLISRALLMKQLDTTPAIQDPFHSSMRITGNPVASGVALGKAVIMQKNALEEPERKTNHSAEIEWDQFREALDHSITDILELIDKISDHLSPDEAAIFHAHLMFLEDHTFQDKIHQYIEEGASAAWSIYQAIQDYLQAFAEIADPYLRERGDDLKDVGYRLLHHLGYGQLSSFDKEGILVTKELLPADVAHLDTSKIKGIITSTGGALSHAAILARSRLIPALYIAEEALGEIKEGDIVAIDGQVGYAVINPSEQVLEEFQRLLIERERYLNHLEEFRDKPCQTKDGSEITMLANIGLLSDTQMLNHYGAVGIGLYRTEVYFLSLDRYPSIEEQVEVYSKIMASAGTDRPIIFRTLDIGADKSAPYMGFTKEENPFLGNRAIRHQMENPTPLKRQIEAVLIAAQNHPEVRLLFPMVSQLSEIRFARQLYEECREDLQKRGYTPPSLSIGMMFEVPAAFLISEQFAQEVDFFSIGSNDLTQYILAVDRNNPHVAHLYDPLHPAVLMMIAKLVQVAKKYNKMIELCGEMASDPDGCILLVGLGLYHLSMNPALIPVVKERLSQITLTDAESLAEQSLLLSSAEEVRRHITDFFNSFSTPVAS